MKPHFFIYCFLCLATISYGQNTALNSINSNINAQGNRGITADKLSAALNSIVNWAGSPAMKRYTIVQTRALSTDLPNLIQITDGTNAGLFVLDATDNTTADNGSTVIVTTTGSRRYKRISEGVSTVTGLQTALDAKASVSNPTFTGTVSGITKSMVGLGNVDNTTDANKPVSTATQTALNLKAPLASPTFTGTISGVTKAMVGLGNVDNTADASKPVSTAAQTALNLKANLASPTFSGTVTLPGTTNIGNVSSTELSHLDGLTFGIRDNFAKYNSYNRFRSTNMFYDQLWFIDSLNAGTTDKYILKPVNDGSYTVLKFGYQGGLLSENNFVISRWGVGVGKDPGGFSGLDVSGSLRAGVNLNVGNSSYLATTAGNVGIGTETPESTSLVDMSSTTRGLLIPRMTQAQRTAISSPAAGLQVYQTNNSVGTWIYQGGSWVRNITESGGVMSGDITLNHGVRVGGTSMFGGNSLLGRDALIGYTSGGFNTAIGNSALSTLSSANYNTAVGHFALKNTNAAGNTGIGVSALESNSTGTYNVAVGLNSLISTTSGGSNVAAGFYSLGSTTTGSRNVAIGYEAGRYNTGSNNTYVGGYTGFGNTNRSGRVWISDGQGNVRIMADSLGNVGIGTSNPTVALHVVTNSTTVPLTLQNTLNTGYTSIRYNDDAGFQRLSVGYGNSNASVAALRGNAYMITYSTNPILFYTNSLERMRVGETGNVGIGTTTPAAKLHIADVALSDTSIHARIDGNLVSTQIKSKLSFSDSAYVNITIDPVNGSDSKNDFSYPTASFKSLTKAFLWIAKSSSFNISINIRNSSISNPVTLSGVTNLQMLLTGKRIIINTTGEVTDQYLDISTNSIIQNGHFQIAGAPGRRFKIKKISTSGNMQFVNSYVNIAYVDVELDPSATNSFFTILGSRIRFSASTVTFTANNQGIFGSNYGSTVMLSENSSTVNTWNIGSFTGSKLFSAEDQFTSVYSSNHDDFLSKFSIPAANVYIDGKMLMKTRSISSTYTAAITDRVINVTSGTFTLTLPTAVGIPGSEFLIRNTGAGTITIASAAGTFDGASTITLPAGQKTRVVSDGTKYGVW